MKCGRHGNNLKSMEVERKRAISENSHSRFSTGLCQFYFSVCQYHNLHKGLISLILDVYIHTAGFCCREVNDELLTRPALRAVWWVTSVNLWVSEWKARQRSASGSRGGISQQEIAASCNQLQRISKALTTSERISVAFFPILKILLAWKRFLQWESEYHGSPEAGIDF